MEPVVIVVRGINVGSTRKVPMADLRAACAAVGCTEVATYIQSGNAVARSPLPPAALESAVEAELAARFPFAPAVIVRTGAEWRALADSPIHADVDDPTTRIVWIARHPIDGAAMDELDQAAFAPEVAVADGRELHLHLPNGQARAKLPDALAKALGNPMVTARNWRTVEKLRTMVDELAEP